MVRMKVYFLKIWNLSYFYDIFKKKLVNYNGGLISNHGDEYEQIIKSCIKIQCKDEQKSNIKRIFYKQPTWASAQVFQFDRISQHAFQEFLFK